jgi:para-aminobenzoate synthetase
VRVLLIDNYDSYTYNLFQLIARVYGIEPVVIHNDDRSWPGLDLAGFDAAVISPGPGHPGRPRDFGHSMRLLRKGLPVLGVCLGHQGVAHLAGAQVQPAPQPRHGHLSTVRHSADGLFAGIPQDFTAVRYHSLAVAEPLPAQLRVTARAEDGVVMGIEHRSLPQWGVQFHPESVCTQYGEAIIANFRDLARGHARPSPTRQSPSPTSAPPPAGAPGHAGPARSSKLRACVLQLPYQIDAERAFVELYGASPQAFWLDSSKVEPGLSRFTFMGDTGGPDSEVLTYRVADGFVTVQPAHGVPHAEAGTIFESLRNRTGVQVHGLEDLPFDFDGGYVGYFGYELKADCGAASVHKASTPDAVWLRADRFIAVDHLEHRTYVVGVTEAGMKAGIEAAWAWVEQTGSLLAGSEPEPTIAVAPENPADVETTADISNWLLRSPADYLKDVETCRRELRRGESYEICLTNSLRLPAPVDDLEYYRRLRRLNPAPYAAFLRLGEVSVMCSSPERFLRIDGSGRVESKPIKGTAARSPDPDVDAQLRRQLQTDNKARAENLMIVDLLRNDLGRVCEVGTVEVPRFMAVESYATVHQLVSTVTGRLRAGVDAMDCVRACFPGGSMTGAPKLRTMEIIDSVETQARGVYSGSLGYLSLSGAADLNIVIRTAVRRHDELRIGAGGAIVLDSDPVAEYDEMVLKAQAPVRALLGNLEADQLGRSEPRLTKPSAAPANTTPSIAR